MVKSIHKNNVQVFNLTQNRTTKHQNCLEYLATEICWLAVALMPGRYPVMYFKRRPVEVFLIKQETCLD